MGACSIEARPLLSAASLECADLSDLLSTSEGVYELIVDADPAWVEVALKAASQSCQLLHLLAPYFPLVVSRLGSYALAGVGLGGIINFMVICFPIGLLGGAKILISQAVGAGQRDSVQAYLGAAIWLAMVMAAVATPVAFGVATMLPAVSASEAAGEASRTYLSILAIGALPVLVRIAIEQARFATGDSQSPMRVNVFANVANVFFNYLFIFVLDMGVAGAGYGTLVAGILGCLAMLGVQASDGRPQ